jgi:hypothetical protein
MLPDPAEYAEKMLRTGELRSVHFEAMPLPTGELSNFVAARYLISLAKGKTGVIHQLDSDYNLQLSWYSKL